MHPIKNKKNKETGNGKSYYASPRYARILIHCRYIYAPRKILYFWVIAEFRYY
jgi:hypothetical protein